MKLRRAMAAAAATAAIAPLALLSAPVAFATDEAGSATSATPAATPTDTAAPTPSATPTDTEEPEKEPGDEPEDETTDTPPAKPSKPTKPSKSSKPPKSHEVIDDIKDEALDDADEETEEPLDCPVDDDGVDVDSVLEVDLAGLPKKIVKGSGWHRFELSLTNPTDEELGEVKWIAAVNDKSYDKDDEDRLGNYTDLEYFDTKSGDWEAIDADLNGGLAFDVTDLGAEEQVDIKLRVAIDSEAPTGDSYAVGLGGYLDTEQNCTHTTDAYEPLTVVKPGSSGETPGTAAPTPDKTPSAEAKKPQGSPEALPSADSTGDTGSLAETGSSSMLPTVALVGGIAVVAGAGVVFAVRRRKADTAA
ncbi:LAETG motif-containing sortase-dependent surface protein [Streptomyces sp. NPDC029674]|uniref:LAETG motif-containing sortase-dependent surface protein n=1 Tax=Streptomyces sp. NPDC029674 TaxID=3365297 RepID=UPI00384B8879